MQKIKLVYILGFGHSGSTLLDLILGAMPKAESVGEIIRLRKELDWNHPCTCGIDLKDCPYWTPVLSAFESKLEEYADSQDIYEFTKVLRKPEAQSYFSKVFKGLKAEVPHDLVKNYGQRTYALFEEILKHSGRDYIVDSSKNHRRLILLWLSGLFDIKVIYLYRNSPELINSLRRRMSNEFKEVMDHNKGRELDPEYVKRLKKKLDKTASPKDIAKYVVSIRQSLKNKLKSLDYLKAHGLAKEDLFFLNYRQMVENPSEVIKFISEQFDLDFNENALDYNSEEYFLKNMGHNLGGNFMRTKGAKPITAKTPKPLSTLDTLLNGLLGGRSSDNEFAELIK